MKRYYAPKSMKFCDASLIKIEIHDQNPQICRCLNLHCYFPKISRDIVRRVGAV